MHAERRAWAATHVGKARPINEDCCLVGEWRSGKAAVENWRGSLSLDATWAVVADGMGGHGAGDVASRVVVDAIAELVHVAKEEADITAMLQTVNRQLFEAMYAADGRPGMGTTVVGALLLNGSGLVFNVGDSRAYIFRAGRLAQLSRDHTLNIGNGSSRRRSHALTQSLGGSMRPQTLQVHIRRTPLKEQDALMLCSDGLTDMIDDQEIADILVRHKSNPAEHLVAAALDAGGRDNITVVVIGGLV